MTRGRPHLGEPFCSVWNISANPTIEHEEQQIRTRVVIQVGRFVLVSSLTTISKLSEGRMGGRPPTYSRSSYDLEQSDQRTSPLHV